MIKSLIILAAVFLANSAMATGPISNISISINNNAAYATSPNVTLAITATGATQMYLTNDSGCQTGGQWQDFDTQSDWTLGQTNQLTHVYMRVKNTDFIDPTCYSAQITEDDVPPAVKFTSTPPQITNLATAQFQISVTDNISTVIDTFCSLDQGSYAACGAHISLTNLASGTHTFSAYAVDNAGNQSQPISYSWTVSTAAPVITITQAPSNPTSNTVSNFSFTVADTILIMSEQCQIDGGAFADCSSPVSYNLSNGTHTFVVKATDAAGNSGLANYTWLIDSTAPVVTITQKPANPSADLNPSFSFTVQDTQSIQSTKCSVDGAAATDCKSPTAYALANGAHTFSVTATDVLGNTGSANYSWTITTAAPVVTITQSPSSLTNSTAANFSFTVTDALAISSTQCSIDGGAPTNCFSPTSYTLPSGNHTFVVTATDVAGKSGSANYSWTIDTVAPVVKITSAPANPTTDTAAKFAFTVTDAQTIQSTVCSIDGAAATNCTSPTSYTLAAGSHTFAVTATDVLGNIGSANYSWIIQVIDTPAPVVTITQAPNNPTASLKASFSFTVTSSVAIASTKCSVDSAAATNCVSPAAYTLTAGAHTFLVTATDVSGKSGSANYSWTITKPTDVTTQDIQIAGSNNKADILFVVNDASTMYSELRGSVHARLSHFVSQLGKVDYQIAVTTADATTPSEYQSGNLARILYQAEPGAGIANVPAEYTITPKSPYAQRDFLATITRPEAICQRVSGICPDYAFDYQEAIHATLETLQNQNSVSKFVRNDAALNVVIISDKDEGLGYLTDKNGNAVSGIPEYNKPSTLVNFVKTKWPSKKLVVHAITQRPQDNNCFNQNYSTTKSYLYSQLVKMTGGASANICDEDDTSQITNIAQSIATQEAQSSYTLKCTPKSAVTATFDPKPSTAIQVIVQGNTISFKPVPPTGTTVHLQYVCP